MHFRVQFLQGAPLPIPLGAPLIFNDYHEMRAHLEAHYKLPVRADCGHTLVVMTDDDEPIDPVLAQAWIRQTEALEEQARQAAENDAQS